MFLWFGYRILAAPPCAKISESRAEAMTVMARAILYLGNEISSDSGDELNCIFLQVTIIFLT